MSIIPGIEIAAPERTETSSGSSVSPKRFPERSSSRATCSATSSSSPSGRSPVSIVRAAGVRRDREPGRHRQPEQRHLGEADPLAAEELPAAAGMLVEVVDEPGHPAMVYHASSRDAVSLDGGTPRAWRRSMIWWMRRPLRTGWPQLALMSLTGVFALLAAEYTFHFSHDAPPRPQRRGLQQRDDRGGRRVPRPRGRAQARAARLARDGRRGARVGDRQHDLDVHGRRASRTRRTRRPPTSASSPSTRRRTSPSCCCCAPGSGTLRSSLWLDGVIGAPRGRRGRDARSSSRPCSARSAARSAAIATNLAYPLADLTLIGMVVWALALTGWRPGRRWGLIVGRPARVLGQRLPLPVRDRRRHVLERLADRPRLGRRRPAARLGGVAAGRRPGGGDGRRLGAAASRRSASACSGSASSSTTTSTA